jgi:hypothetical protein
MASLDCSSKGSYNALNFCRKAIIAWWDECIEQYLFNPVEIRSRYNSKAKDGLIGVHIQQPDYLWSSSTALFSVQIFIEPPSE